MPEKAKPAHTLETESLRNWRLLEHEITTILLRHGVALIEDRATGDKLINLKRTNTELNVTSFAQELSLRVSVNVTPVKVMKGPTQ